MKDLKDCVGIILSGVLEFWSFGIVLPVLTFFDRLTK
jgi:hypothetical protein